MLKPCLVRALLTLISVPALDGLTVSPLRGALITQLGFRPTPPAAATARMGLGGNGTNAGGQIDPVAAAKAAMELRTRQARQEQEEAQEAWRVKQAREAEQKAQAQARRDKVAETEVYGLSAADQAKASLEAMFSIDATEAAAAEAVEVATDSTADAERGAAAAAREREMAELDLAAASRRSDAEATKRASERLATADAAADAAKAAGGAAKGDMSSALAQQAEAAVAAAAKARSISLSAAAVAAAAEREAAEALGETAGFVAAKWQETQQQLWGAAESIMGSVMSTPLAKGQVAPGRTGKDFADDWQRYREKYELTEVSSETDPGDPMDALEELWNTRIRRSLEATAEEVKTGLFVKLQRAILTGRLYILGEGQRAR